MGFLRIHCASCNGTWDVYERNDWKQDQNRACPHCHAEIDEQDWKNHIIPAFASMMDLNRELFKTHTGYHSPLFTADYIEDHYFPDTANETAAALSNLNAHLDDIGEIARDMVTAVNAMSEVILDSARKHTDHEPDKHSYDFSELERRLDKLNEVLENELNALDDLSIDDFDLSMDEFDFSFDHLDLDLDDDFSKKGN